LRQEELGDLGLGALALALALAATELRPSLAVPLFVGGMAVMARGVRAVWRRWDLVDRLAGERDAYVISEIRAYAAREATPERRHGHAASIRILLGSPVPALEARLVAVADDLEALACELEDDSLVLDPAAAVSCTRLLNDYAESPLLNAALPSEELRSHVRRIRTGFEPRGRGA
jgi:hypothetical protein